MENADCASGRLLLFCHSTMPNNSAAQTTEKSDEGENQQC
jgi:hypothetical protein